MVSTATTAREQTRNEQLENGVIGDTGSFLYLPLGQKDFRAKATQTIHQAHLFAYLP